MRNENKYSLLHRSCLICGKTFVETCMFMEIRISHCNPNPPQNGFICKYMNSHTKACWTVCPQTSIYKIFSFYLYSFKICWSCTGSPQCLSNLKMRVLSILFRIIVLVKNIRIPWHIVKYLPFFL